MCVEVADVLKSKYRSIIITQKDEKKSQWKWYKKGSGRVAIKTSKRELGHCFLSHDIHLTLTLRYILTHILTILYYIIYICIYTFSPRCIFGPIHGPVLRRSDRLHPSHQPPRRCLHLQLQLQLQLLMYLYLWLLLSDCHIKVLDIGVDRVRMRERERERGERERR